MKRRELRGWELRVETWDLRLDTNWERPEFWFRGRPVAIRGEIFLRETLFHSVKKWFFGRFLLLLSYSLRIGDEEKRANWLLASESARNSYWFPIGNQRKSTISIVFLKQTFEKHRFLLLSNDSLWFGDPPPLFSTIFTKRIQLDLDPKSIF